MIVDDLKKLKYMTNADLNKQLERENNMPLIVVLDICETFKSNEKKVGFILNNFPNNKFYMVTNYYFTSVEKTNEKEEFIKLGKQYNSYDSELLDELVEYFIILSADSSIDIEKAKDFLRGFILNLINNILNNYKVSEENGVE